MPDFGYISGEALIGFYFRFGLVILVWYGSVRAVIVVIREVWSRCGLLD